MINNMLGKINGVGVYYVISMLIFITFFIGVSILLVKMQKNRVDHMKNLPLADDQELN